MLEILRELGELTARFPAFKIRLIRGPYGRQSFEAVRKGGPGDSGLYAVISEAVISENAAEVAAKVAAELRNAA